ncbi:MAG: MBL fold metallo-hydrolase, partial [Clostridium sp.]
EEINNLDGILLSHEHFDHIDMKFLSKFKNKCPIYAPKWSLKPKLVNSKSLCKGDEFTVGEFSITVVQANHICPSFGYIIKAENKTIYFSGDTYYGDFMKDISEKYDVDIAILPVTRYVPPMTMGEKGVVKCLKTLKPKYFIPMHQDIVPRIKLISSHISMDKLKEFIKTEGLITKLVHLENGEFVNINDN